MYTLYSEIMAPFLCQQTTAIAIGGAYSETPIIDTKSDRSLWLVTSYTILPLDDAVFTLTPTNQDLRLSNVGVFI